MVLKVCLAHSFWRINISEELFLSHPGTYRKASRIWLAGCSPDARQISTHAPDLSLWSTGIRIFKRYSLAHVVSCIDIYSAIYRVCRTCGAIKLVHLSTQKRNSSLKMPAVWTWIGNGISKNIMTFTAEFCCIDSVCVHVSVPSCSCRLCGNNSHLLQNFYWKWINLFTES